MNREILRHPKSFLSGMFHDEQNFLRFRFLKGCGNERVIMRRLSKVCLGGFGIVKLRPFFLLTAAHMSYFSLFMTFNFLLIISFEIKFHNQRTVQINFTSWTWRLKEEHTNRLD